MKRILLTAVFLLAITAGGISSFAETRTVWATGSFDVPNVWSLESYTDPKVLYTTEVPFTNMDPTSTWVESDGRMQDSGKMDIGLLCRTNLGETWYMKIQGSAGALVSIAGLKYGMWQPWDRTLNQPSDGEIAGGAGWHDMPTSPTIIYTAGINDENNTPFGTQCAFNFVISNAGKLDPSQVYNCAIQFTFTTTP